MRSAFLPTKNGLHAQVFALFRDMSGLARDEDEWDAAESASPLQMFAGAAPGRVLYVTKSTWLAMCDGWQTLMTGRHGRHISVFTRYGLVPRVYADVVRAEMRRTRAKELGVVGDLDPLDLTVFLLLRCGGLGRRQERISLRVQWLGVRDEWLAACDRQRRRARKGAWGTMEMTPFEVEHWRRLEELPVRWENVVGARSVELLRSGRKMELEGASNPAIYGERFAAKVRALTGLKA